MFKAFNNTFNKVPKLKKVLIGTTFLSSTFLIANTFNEDFSTFSMGYNRSMRALYADLKILINYKWV